MVELYVGLTLRLLSSASAASSRPSSGTSSGSLLPPVKLNFGAPLQRTAGAGVPGGSKGPKSNAMKVSLQLSTARPREGGDAEPINGLSFRPWTPACAGVSGECADARKDYFAATTMIST